MQRSPEILVVDDEEDILCFVSELLSMSGYTVRTAANGRDALTALVNWHPQLIVMDLAMPVMDGWSFLAAQRADAALAQIPVIVMSASSQLRTEGPSLDVAAELCKPFPLTDLLSKVAELTA